MPPCALGTRAAEHPPAALPPAQVILGAGVAAGALLMLLCRYGWLAALWPATKQRGSDGGGRAYKEEPAGPGSSPLPPQAAQLASLFSVAHRHSSGWAAGAMEQVDAAPACSNGAAPLVAATGATAAGPAGLPASVLGGSSPADALTTADGALAAALLACHRADAAAALIAAARSLTAQASASLLDGGRWAAAGGRGSSLVGGRRDSDLVRRGRQAVPRQQLVAAIGSRGAWVEEGEDDGGGSGSNKHA